MRITDATGLSDNPLNANAVRIILYNRDGGATTGIAKITQVRNIANGKSSLVWVNVLQHFAGAQPMADWDFGAFGGDEGFPTSVALHDGRLWWAKGDELFGSVSDAYWSFDADMEGESAPVLRSLGQPARQSIKWLASAQRLIAGTELAEISIRSSNFDSPITPLDFVARKASSRGCADIQAEVIDSDVIFVQRSKCRLYVMRQGGGMNDYVAYDLTELHPDVCQGSTIKRMAVQRQPDTRLWCLLDNGKLICLTYEPERQIISWSRHSTGVSRAICSSIPVN